MPVFVLQMAELPPGGGMVPYTDVKIGRLQKYIDACEEH